MRRRVLGAALLAVLLLAVTLCLLGNPEVVLHNRQLKNALTALPEGNVTLNEVVPFAWDAVYTFAPYASREEMEQTIGFARGELQESVNEGMVQLVFVKGQQVTASVCAYPEALGYRVTFTDCVCAEEKAVFTVSREDGLVSLRRWTA